MVHMVLKMVLRDKIACRNLKDRPMGELQVGAFRSDTEQ
jgi:hypothetical protein